MPPQILIVGLGEVGTAIGLAMGRSLDPPTLFGYDRDKAAASAALESGAFERRVLDPRKTAAEVDLVVLAMPQAEASELIDDLLGALKPGAILLDLTPQPHDPQVLSRLGDQAGRIIRGTLVVSAEGLIAPHTPSVADANLFRGGSLGLAIDPETPEDSIELALSVAESLGSTPFFIDPSELEFVMAAVDLLPALLGLMLLRTLSGAPGWGNVERLAGRPFAAYIDHALVQGDKLTESLWSRRTSLLGQLGRLAQEVASFEAAFGAETSEPLESLVDQALEARDDWMQVRHGNRPNSGGDPLPPNPGILGNLFGFRPRRPPDGDQA